MRVVHNRCTVVFWSCFLPCFGTFKGLSLNVVHFMQHLPPSFCCFFFLLGSKLVAVYQHVHLPSLSRSTVVLITKFNCTCIYSVHCNWKESVTCR